MEVGKKSAQMVVGCHGQSNCKDLHDEAITTRSLPTSLTIVHCSPLHSTPPFLRYVIRRTSLKRLLPDALRSITSPAVKNGQGGSDIRQDEFRQEDWLCGCEAQIDYLWATDALKKLIDDQAHHYVFTCCAAFQPTHKLHRKHDT